MLFPVLPIALIAAVSALEPVPGAQETKHFRSLEDIGALMDDYASEKRPDDVLAAIEWLFVDRAFDDAPGLYWPFAAFLSGCFVVDKSLADRAWKASRERGDYYEQTLVLSATWLAHTPWCDEVLSDARRVSVEPRMIKLAASYLDEPSTFFESTDPVGRAVEVDMLWGRFKATSDQAIVRRVLLTAASEETPLVSSAAEWSLGSMIEQDDRVKAAVLSLREEIPPIAPEDLFRRLLDGEQRP